MQGTEAARTLALPPTRAEAAIASSSNPANTLGWNCSRVETTVQENRVHMREGAGPSEVGHQSASNQGLHPGEKVKPVQQSKSQSYTIIEIKKKIHWRESAY